MESLISRVLVPTEKVTEIKGGKKRITQRKQWPGYVMVEMAITEETTFLVKNTSGVGDFVGPNAKTPVPLTAIEVEKMLGDAKKTAEESQPKVHITFSPGDSVNHANDHGSGPPSEQPAQDGGEKREPSAFHQNELHQAPSAGANRDA